MSYAAVRLIPLPLMVLCVFTLTPAANLYVSASATGSPDGTRAHPFAAIQAAADTTHPGDTVFVMDGTYSNSWWNGNVVDITRAGSASAWIVYMALPTQHPKLQFNGWGGFNITGASYIEINGFEIVGNNAKMDSATAVADRSDGNNCLTSGNGISVSQSGTSPYPHHIVIRKCAVHDCGGGGISTQTADYITVEDNIVYNNAWYSPYDCSGISLGWNYNQDNDTTNYKIFVCRNICYANRNCVPAIQGGDVPTDGEGIIIDIQDGTAGNVPAYTGRILIENNLVFDNGGDGICLFKTNHVDVINNTAYLNDQTPEINRGQIFPNQGKNTRILNNIMFSAAGRYVIQDCCPNTNLSVDYNVFWSAGGSPSASLIGKSGPHDRKADPLFASPSTNAAVADFRLQAGSAAIDNGTSLNAPNTDINGAPRPSGAGVDIGAYEYYSSAHAQPEQAARDVGGPQMSICPNTFTGGLSIRLGARGTVGIFALDGTRLGGFTNVLNAEWMPKAVAHEMYIVKADINGEKWSTKLCIMR